MEQLIIGTNGAVAGIDAGTGHVRWRTPLKTGSLFSPTGSQDVSVLQRGTIVFAGCAGHLYCIDADTGAVLWHNALDGFGHNDISLAMEGVSVQFVQKVQPQSSS